jgi:hypothetical protein
MVFEAGYIIETAKNSDINLGDKRAYPFVSIPS